MILHAYSGRAFAKSDSEDIVPHLGVDRITKFLIEWKEKLSRIVDHVELKKNDYNISTNRYIHADDAETYRPVPEFVVDLDVIEVNARDTDKILRNILEKLGG